jgi:hypothetical protein
MARIPREAREGIMRAWLAILRERHPDVIWIQVTQTSQATNEEHRDSLLTPITA